jgi:hypothetical protein
MYVLTDGRENPKSEISGRLIADLHPNGTVRTVFIAHTGRGKGPQQATDAWVRGGVNHVGEGWKAGGLVGRIERLLVLAKDVRPAVDLLEFTYRLPGDCDYVGGARHSYLQRFWHRVKGVS